MVPRGGLHFGNPIKVLSSAGGTNRFRTIARLSGAGVPPSFVRKHLQRRSTLNGLSFEQVAIKVAGSVEHFYSRDHLPNKIKAGEFPRPVYLFPKKQVWVEAEIDRYLTELAAKRELRGAK